jgi:hypothetical protein
MNDDCQCIYCGSDISTGRVLFYTDAVGLNELVDSSEDVKIEEYKKFPMKLIECPACDLVQTEKRLPLDSMFRDYRYFSSANRTMVGSLREIAKKSVSLIDKFLANGPNGKLVAMDIGCNDFTMLDFPEFRGFYKIGVDPSSIALQNSEEALKNRSCHKFFNTYFPLEKEAEKDVPLADIITSIAMFYDVPNPVEFMSAIYRTLSSQGVWICQLSDLGSMILWNIFDNICHEHIAYYSLSVFKKIAERCGLSVFRVEKNYVNGGSLRIYCDKGFREQEQSVEETIGAEKLAIEQMFYMFPVATLRARSSLNKLYSLKNGKIGIIAASTKGNTILSLSHISNKDAFCIFETDLSKVGKIHRSSGIQIVDERNLDEICESEGIETLVVMPWYYREFFDRKFLGFMKKSERNKVFYPIPFLNCTYFNQSKNRVEISVV